MSRLAEKIVSPFFGKKKNTSDLYSEMEIKLFLGRQQNH